jgi:NAD+ synthase
MTGSFSSDVLKLDAAEEVDRIGRVLRDQVFQRFKRRGVVLGLSGGIDSSVSAALCARSLGPERVLGLFMPESESSDDSLRLGRLLADSLGITHIQESIGPILEASGCYRRRDDVIRTLVPGYTKEHKYKIVLPRVTERSAYSISSLVVQSPDGELSNVRLTADAYRTIVASTNFKQRVRKMMEYYHADRLHYAVVGTPNRLEYDQGFFVKNGDGSADLKPIAHLYKQQVYQLAACLNVPDEIRRRPPTTDTYSLEQSQEEFYFSVPLEKMDLCLYGKNHGIAPEEVAPAVGLTVGEVAQVYSQIDSKRAVTRYLHWKPLLAGPDPLEQAFDRARLPPS